MGRARDDLSKQSKVTAGIPWGVLLFMAVVQRERLSRAWFKPVIPEGEGGHSGRRSVLIVLDSVRRENKHLGAKLMDQPLRVLKPLQRTWICSQHPHV